MFSLLLYIITYTHKEHQVHLFTNILFHQSSVCILCGLVLSEVYVSISKIVGMPSDFNKTFAL